MLCFLDFVWCELLLLFNAAHMREPTQGQPDSETFAFNVEAMFANFKRITGSFIHVFMYTQCSYFGQVVSRKTTSLWRVEKEDPDLTHSRIKLSSPQ